MKQIITSVTRKQLKMLYTQFNTPDAEIPRKGMQTILQFPMSDIKVLSIVKDGNMYNVYKGV